MEQEEQKRNGHIAHSDGVVNNKSILRFQRLVEYERENSTSLDTALVYYIKMKSQLQEIN
jgi:hypothetical protein